MEPAKGQTGNVPTILYIEDDALNRRLVKRILEPLGYRVLSAEDGLSGIDTAQRERPDLILMDINLPDIDGLGATVKIRAIPELAHVPVVALTAGGFDRARERSLTLGCSGFISKPIDMSTFPTRIRQYLDGFREQISKPVGRDTAELFIRDESLALVSRLEDKIRELTIAKRELEGANQALGMAFEELKSAHEAERRLNKARSDFIAVSSHELRTPLAVIAGYLDLLLSGHTGELPKETQRILKVSQRNIMRLSSTVTSLSEAARFDSVGLILDFEPVYVEDVVEEHLLELGPALEVRSIAIETDLAHPPRPINGDRERISALVQRLLMNAIRYTPDGGTVSVRTEVLERDVLLTVRDTGIGVAAENLERIFEPFFRVQDALHHSSGTFEFQSGGIGLGLTLARGIVASHGGTIHAESDGVGKGTAFVVRLPRA